LIDWIRLFVELFHFSS